VATHLNRPIRVAHVATIDATVRYLLLGQLRRLVSEGFEVTAISAPGPWVGEIEAAGIRHLAWEGATRAWDPVADLRALRSLVRILRRERFDVVHTHNPKPGILGRVVARLTGVPCIVNTVHGLYATPEDPPVKRAIVLGLERAASRLSDLELYQSEEDLAWARRIGLVSERSSLLLGNGTDLSFFDAAAVSSDRRVSLRQDLGIAKDEHVVGTVGRLVAEKGYREFFAAARTVRRAEPRVRFLAVGGIDAAKADAIRDDEIARARADVVFTGWREDVRDLISIMDVFVLASWREGLPRSAIEAAAMGSGLVLTDIRGCREVVRHGVDGLLVPPRNQEALGRAILELVRDPELRDRLGSAARDRARSRFDEEKVASIVVDNYRQLLSRKGVTGEAGDGVRFRRARPSDAPVLARLHREGLPEAFLPQLGDRFLRCFYRALAADDGAVVYVAEDEAGVVGFLSGVLSVRAFYRRFFRRHGLRAALAASSRLVRPRILRRALQTARYPTDVTGFPDAELLSIAVDGRSRQRGLGTALNHLVIRDLARLGADEIKGVVWADNDRSNRLYQRLGFRNMGRVVVHEGKPSNVWVFDCRSLSPSGSRSS
jgi:glycosyltransferase involved in cell wall biosynthesis/ribosomal protein S18 acetylase RimI-like enzyme